MTDYVYDSLDYIHKQSSGRALDDLLESGVEMSKNIIVIFFHSDCGHCEQFMEVWNNYTSETRVYDNLRFAAVDCREHLAVCTMWQIRRYPKLYLFSDVGERLDVPVDHFAELFENFKYKVVGLPQSVNVTKRNHVKWSIEKDREADAAGRYVDALIGAELSVKPSQLTFPLPLEPLAVWSGFLKRLFPQHSLFVEIHTFATTRLAQGHNATSLMEYSSENFWDNIVANPRKLKTCRNQSKTCTYWSLFHVAVEYNRHAPRDCGSHIQEVIITWASNLLSCEQCRIHFLKAMDSCSFKRCEISKTKITGRRLAIFLYQQHNDVNLRTRKNTNHVVWPGYRSLNNEDEILEHLAETYYAPEKLHSPLCKPSHANVDLNLQQTYTKYTVYLFGLGTGCFIFLILLIIRFMMKIPKSKDT